MRFPKIYYVFLGVGVFCGLALLTYATQGAWRPLFKEKGDNDPKTAAHDPKDEELAEIVLTSQARQNLKVAVKSVRDLQVPVYYRKLRVPGTIQERPGGCGFVVTAPFAGVVTKISAQRGELVKPGTPVFTLKILSEPLMNAQTGLFKADQKLRIIQDEIKRISDLVRQGASPPGKMIELENQLRLQNAEIDGLTQDLRIRGLVDDEIYAARKGDFITETVLRVPHHIHVEPLPGTVVSTKSSPTGEHRHVSAFEVEELKVLTGEFVQAGQTMGHLAEHLVLAIEGKVFAAEVPLLRTAAADGLEVEVDFPADAAHQWLSPQQKHLIMQAIAAQGFVSPTPAAPLAAQTGLALGAASLDVSALPSLKQVLKVHYFANKLDADSQTLGVHLLLINQHLDYQRDGKTYRLWRFRPGQRVMLRLPVEEFKEVLVVPAKAIVHEGGEAYAFSENGKRFMRAPVQVVYEDSDVALISNEDGTFAPNERLVLNAAAALNRALKAKAQVGGGHSHDH